MSENASGFRLRIETLHRWITPRKGVVSMLLNGTDIQIRTTAVKLSAALEFTARIGHYLAEHTLNELGCGLVVVAT